VTDDARVCDTLHEDDDGPGKGSLNTLWPRLRRELALALRLLAAHAPHSPNAVALDAKMRNPDANEVVG
jgi:hypothetical protein